LPGGITLPMIGELMIIAIVVRLIGLVRAAAMSNKRSLSWFSNRRASAPTEKSQKKRGRRKNPAAQFN